MLIINIKIMLNKSKIVKIKNFYSEFSIYISLQIDFRHVDKIIIRILIQSFRNEKSWSKMLLSIQYHKLNQNSSQYQSN